MLIRLQIEIAGDKLRALIRSDSRYADTSGQAFAQHRLLCKRSERRGQGHTVRTRPRLSVPAPPVASWS